MNRKKTKQYPIIYLGLCLGLLGLLFLNIYIGSVKVTPRDVWQALLGSKVDETIWRIVWYVRMPRILAAVLLGGALAVAGFLLQTFFANPIAGPFVLGISSGAKLCVAILLVFAVKTGETISSFSMIGMAFLGALLSMGFVLMVSGKVKNMSMLIVCGIMIGYICSAITEFLITFSEDSNIVNLHNWSMGSFSGISFANLKICFFLISFTLLITMGLSKPMGAYLLGEAYARNMGVNITLLRVFLILCSSFLSAAVTAYAGPVSFVGIAVPHLCRVLFKTDKPLYLIPGCFLGGAVFCLFCDLLARTMFAPIELSISSVTAVFGAPVVIYMMVRRKGL